MPYFLINKQLRHLWPIHMLHTLDPFHHHLPQTPVRMLKIPTSIIPGIAYLGTMRSFLPILFLSLVSAIKIGVIIPIHFLQTADVWTVLIKLQFLLQLWYLPGETMMLWQDLDLLCIHFFMVPGKKVFHKLANQKCYTQQSKHNTKQSLSHVDPTHTTVCGPQLYVRGCVWIVVCVAVLTRRRQKPNDLLLLLLGNKKGVGGTLVCRGIEHALWHLLWVLIFFDGMWRNIKLHYYFSLWEVGWRECFCFDVSLLIFLCFP